MEAKIRGKWKGRLDNHKRSFPHRRIPASLYSLPADPACLLWWYARYVSVLDETLLFSIGYDATAYMGTLNILEKEQVIGKVVLLTASETGEREAPLHPLPQFKLDAVFTTDKLPRVTRKLAPLTVGTSNNVTTNGGLISPQSPARPVGRLIDPCLARPVLFLHPLPN